MWVKCAAAFAAAIVTLPAQQWEVAPIGGYLRLSKKPIGSLNQAAPRDDDTKLTPRQPAYGIAVTLNTKGYYGVEGGILRSRAGITSRFDLGDGDDVVQSGTVTQHQAFFNGISYFMPLGERFRPYATGGFQAQLWSAPNLPNWSGGSSKNIGFNYGGGVKIRIAKPVLFRLDVRDIWAGAPYSLQYENSAATSLRSPGLFRQLQGTIGIGIIF